MKNIIIILSERRNNSAKDYDLIKILIALFLPYLALSVAQNGFLGLLPFVREEFALTRVQVGYYSTFFFISASLLSVFSGSIVDSLGPKRSMLLGIGCLSFFLLLQGLSPFYSLILLLSFLSGLGFSIITPSATKTVMMATPREKRAFSMGFTQSGFGLGGILGASVLPFLGESMGWRVAVQIAAVVVLFTGFFVYKLYQDKENNNNIIYTSEAKKSKRDTFWEHLSSIIADKLLFRICFIAGCSISLLKLDDQLKFLLDAPCDTPV
jgi:MFS family permease